jgi:cephalosporin-C deacetylase-like acetyl esterase
LFAWKPPRDYRQETPVSDDIFRVYKAQFDYDPTDLKAVVEERDTTATDWIREKITFTAGYADERVTALLFLPKNKKPPLQVVIYFPTSHAVSVATADQRMWEFRARCESFVKSGRAVLYPVYWGTYERKGDMDGEKHWPTEEYRHAYTEYLVKWVKDYRRAVDYLSTRADIDHDKLAYYGVSWGGIIGTIIPAVEERTKVVILELGGLPPSAFALPEANGLNYVSRIMVPTLMLNGRYDMSIPFESTAQPAFDLLGTPKGAKLLRVYDGGHYIPRKESVRECLEWLDRYLGPVQ